jgi:hypothetical protein
MINQCIPVKPVGNGIDPTPCGPPGSAVECDLGTTCVVTGTVDPCAQSGFVCTSTNLFVNNAPFSTCQFPVQFSACVVGGPACQPIANSSATNLQCLNLQAAGGNLCLQPCVTASDCVDPLNGCYAAGDGKACITDFGPNVNTTCTKAYTTCNSSGTNDGLCVEFGVGNGQNALICVQEATDGGGVGACCGGGTRQSGNNCAYPNICNGGLCAQVCDPNPPAGADAGFPCDQTNGPQYCFFPGIATAGDVTGTCTPPCDALDLGDAGSCPAPTGGNPAQICNPAFLFDQSLDPTVSDTAVGVCSAAPAANVKVLDTGAVCNFPNTTCKEGTVCHFGANDAFCRHLCSPVGSLPDGGDNGCKAGETCFPFTWQNASQTKSTNIGFCDTLCSGSPC